VLVLAAKPPILLGVFGVVILVAGFVAIALLAVFVLRKAPPDGSDIGRDPRLEGDEERRRNGGGTPPAES
jgi:hypothetical protein